MSVSCQPSDLVKLSKCFPCLTKKQLATQQIVGKRNVANRVIGGGSGICVTPSAPTRLVLTHSPFSNPSSTTIQISWTQKNSGSFITGYKVSWGTTSGGPYTNNSGTLPALPRNYLITGLTPGTTYFIVVQAIAFAGCVSANSSELSAMTTGAPAICAQATAWAAQIVINGGSQPSNATLTAVCNYYNTLVAGGVDTLMIADLLFPPDGGLIGGITPFFHTLGNNPWTNHNFVNGDLTATGLTGDGATKYLATGIIDNAAWASGTEFGMGYYYTAVNNNAIDMGSLDINASNQSRLTTNPVGNSIVLDAFDNANINPVYPFALFGSPHAGGFISGVRQSGARADVYAGNSVVPFASIGNQLGQGAGRPLGFELFCCAVNNNNGGPAAFTQQTMQWAGVFRGLGMDLAHATTLFNAIQALQVAFGRAQ